ncbi:hypothetical protein GGQ85_001591 [Nitrobacter vulgaris]|nr:hypothetical protein [Nitrobacter vulgaris]
MPDDAGTSIQGKTLVRLVKPNERLAGLGMKPISWSHEVYLKR